MRYIGLDLALTTRHKAVVVDDRGRAQTPVLSIGTTPTDLEVLFARAREHAPANEPLAVVMEPTSLAWFPVAVFSMRHGVTVYVVTSQQVADLRRSYRKHAKSDRIDARVLAKLPVVDSEKLQPLHLTSGMALACQRACKEMDRLKMVEIAIHNRLLAIDRFAWPGLETVFPDALGSQVRWFREQWYDPQAVVQAGEARLIEAGSIARLESSRKIKDSVDWAKRLVQLAQQALALYGGAGEYLDYAAFQAEVHREQTLLATIEQAHQDLETATVRSLYRQLHPSRNLETIYGVGEESAAVYVSFIGDPKRFANHAAVRGWSGLIPHSAQTGASDTKGMHITQAGPDLIKKYAYLNADIARHWDPQMAALYYRQMVDYGKHHTQAVCACATHLLDRVWTVLKEERPYEMRDVNGKPVTVEEARKIIVERYTVSKEVRARNKKQVRRERAERRAEHKFEWESRPRLDRGKS